MDERRRAILQGIIDATDSTPAEKLRAVELLNVADGGGHNRPDFRHLTDDELDAAEDADLSAALVDLLRQELDGIEPPHLTGKLFPNGLPLTVAALAAELQRRAEARARELADAARIEAEIERKAHERAEEMYRGRSFAAVEGAQTLQDGSSASSLA